MKNTLILVATALFVVVPGSGVAQTDILWAKFEVNRIYRDSDANCFGSTAKGQLLFSAEVEDGEVKTAQLQNFTNTWPYSAVYKFRELSKDELNSIELYRDTVGRWWVTRLELTEPSFRWALYEGNRHYSFCKTPRRLKTVTPKGFTFTFETEGLKEGIWVSESNATDVAGTRKDGKPYTGSIQLTQREFKDGL